MRFFFEASLSWCARFTILCSQMAPVKTGERILRRRALYLHALVVKRSGNGCKRRPCITRRRDGDGAPLYLPAFVRHRRCARLTRASVCCRRLIRVLFPALGHSFDLGLLAKCVPVARLLIYCLERRRCHLLNFFTLLTWCLSDKASSVFQCSSSSSVLNVRCIVFHMQLSNIDLTP